MSAFCICLQIPVQASETKGAHLLAMASALTNPKLASLDTYIIHNLVGRSSPSDRQTGMGHQPEFAGRGQIVQIPEILRTRGVREFITKLLKNNIRKESTSPANRLSGA